MFRKVPVHNDKLGIIKTPTIVASIGIMKLQDYTVISIETSEFVSSSSSRVWRLLATRKVGEPFVWRDTTGEGNAHAATHRMPIDERAKARLMTHAARV